MTCHKDFDFPTIAQRKHAHGLCIQSQTELIREGKPECLDTYKKNVVQARREALSSNPNDSLG